MLSHTLSVWTQVDTQGLSGVGVVYFYESFAGVAGEAGSAYTDNKTFESIDSATSMEGLKVSCAYLWTQAIINFGERLIISRHMMYISLGSVVYFLASILGLIVMNRRAARVEG
jgi:hypothetical protein